MPQASTGMTEQLPGVFRGESLGDFLLAPVCPYG